MSLFVTPDEGPFVFGAYAAHLKEPAPTQSEQPDIATELDEDQQGEPVTQLAS